MRTKATAIFFLFFFGVIFSSCDNRKSEISQKVINSNIVSQTQNIQQPKDTNDEEAKKAWKKATEPTGQDYSKYNKPLP